MKKTGLADRYLDNLDQWHEMIDKGLTTFAEKPDPTRSDCHAWSASPNYDLLATVCGIRPSTFGFKTVEIAPNLGKLNEIKGRLLLFFPGEYDGNNCYRMLDARDGWNYLATPITCHEGSI